MQIPLLGSGPEAVGRKLRQELRRRSGNEPELKDVGLLALRLVAGGLLAGHGSQKLLGWFGGHGPKGTAGWLASVGFRPAERWALAAGLSELTGGLLTGLGLLNPLGPIIVIAPMTMATAKVHWGKPIWASEGGAELPATNMAIATAVALGGPGRFSLDRLLRIRLPWQLAVLAAAATAAGIAFGVLSSRPAAPAAQEIAGAELQAEGSQTKVGGSS
jgi:putative oxidoreductase